MINKLRIVCFLILTLPATLNSNVAIAREFKYVHQLVEEYPDRITERLFQRLVTLQCSAFFLALEQNWPKEDVQNKKMLRQSAKFSLQIATAKSWDDDTNAPNKEQQRIINEEVSKELNEFTKVYFLNMKLNKENNGDVFDELITADLNSCKPFMRKD
jgi:hypothetical protein